jgi:hypothetical protein
VQHSDVARDLHAAQNFSVKSNQVFGGTFFWFIFFMHVKKMNAKTIKVMGEIICTLHVTYQQLA